MNPTAVVLLVMVWVAVGLYLAAWARLDRQARERTEAERARALGGTIRAATRNREGRPV